MPKKPRSAYMLFGEVARADRTARASTSPWHESATPVQTPSADLACARSCSGRSDEGGACDYRWVEHTARLLFAKYDVNRNGRIERRELKRILEDLHLERFECSECPTPEQFFCLLPTQRRTESPRVVRRATETK